MTETATPSPLSVLLHAADPNRAAVLATMIAGFGHAVAETSDAATVMLADLAAGEAVPDGRHLPILLLTNTASLSRDPDWPAVLPRTASPAQIDAGLRAAAAGLLVRARDLPPATGFAATEDDHAALLTPRELEILAAIGDGMSNKEVARRLGISAHTVKFHLEAVFAKLGAGTRAQAVAVGLRRRLIEA